MSVVYCEELFDGRGGSADKDGRAKYTRKWEVRTDSPYDGAKVATSSPLIPRRGQHYVTPNEEDFFALALDAQADQHPDDPTLWTVTVQYDSVLLWPTGVQPTSPPPPGVPPPPSAPEPGSQAENPLSRPPVWSGSFQTTQKPITRDNAGNPLANGAGLPFDPPPMADVSYPVVRLTRNVATLNLGDLAQLQDAVNSSTWKGIPARQARVTGIEFAPKYENGTAYWEITYQISIKYPDWDFRILDVGYAEKVTDGAGFRWRKIVDKEGREPTEPVPLAAPDGAGQVLKAAPGAAIRVIGPIAYYPGLDFNTYIGV